jgi:hypothetical protein
MKMTVMSCSLTGNNERLARGLAEALSAQHVSVTEPKHRNVGTITFENMLNRTPKVSVPAVRLENQDLAVFVGRSGWVGWQALSVPASGSSGPSSASTHSSPLQRRRRAESQTPCRADQATGQGAGRSRRNAQG